MVFAGAFANAAASAPAQAPPETGSVSGVVTDETGGVMQAVAVRVFPEGGAQPVRETATDGSGGFRVEVPAGAYRVEVSALAFRSVDRLVRAASGLPPLAVTLALAWRRASTSSTRRRSSGSTPSRA